MGFKESYSIWYLRREPDMSSAHYKPDSGVAMTTAAPHTGRTSPHVYTLSVLATIGSFLFGYDTAIVAGAMLYIQPYFGLNTFWQEVIVSGIVGACAVGTLLGGWLADVIGRKKILMASAVLLTLGAVLMGAAPSKEVLLLGRFVTGLGVGITSCVVPVYIAEAAPSHSRGKLVTLHQLMIVIGILVSALTAAGFSYVAPDGWRYMLGLGALPGVVQIVGLFFMPESPRWLAGQGRHAEAEAVLQRMREGDDVSDELREIVQTIEDERAQSDIAGNPLVKVFTTPHVRRALLVGCAIHFFSQFSGINTVIYYSGTALKMAGFPVDSAIWLITIPFAINFFATFIGIYAVERFGRKPLVIGSFIGVIFALAVMAIGYQLTADNPAPFNHTLVEYFDNGTAISACPYHACDVCVKTTACGYCLSSSGAGSCLPALDGSRSTAGRCAAADTDSASVTWSYGFCPSDFTWIALTGMALFVLAFAPGLGPMSWTINSEIYPLWARSICGSLAACTNWFSNLVVSFTFLTLTETLSVHGTFWLFAAITGVGLVVMARWLPETKGKTLEEVEGLFKVKVKESGDVGLDNPAHSAL